MQRKPWAMAWTILSLGVLVYVGILLLFWVFQDRLVYYPTRLLEGTPDEVGLAYESIEFLASDGVRLHGWWIPAPNSQSTVLFLHGNGGNVSHRLDKIRILYDLGLSVFILDYRGYGQSEGRPDEVGTYRDAEAAWSYLTERRGIPPGHIILYGESLGGAVAAYLAQRFPARALVLEAAFTSIPEIAAQLYPFLPVRWLARFRYDTRSYLERVSCPVLIFHSRDDEIVGFSHALRLQATGPAPKVLVELRGGHNDAFLVAQDRYEAGWRDFLRQLRIT
ncbi:MAG: alpha/beta hydrolase [Acidobacteria bacterium]|nr:alpha/beta hydrolase [Acidobacteriota bacterium]MDW7984554.1 alpha/beta hydrolase [Acidobacteriota bacterium]